MGFSCFFIKNNLSFQSIQGYLVLLFHYANFNVLLLQTVRQRFARKCKKAAESVQ